MIQHNYVKLRSGLTKPVHRMVVVFKEKVFQHLTAHIVLLYISAMSYLALSSGSEYQVPCEPGTQLVKLFPWT